MTQLTAAICTFNRADRLRKLVQHLRQQDCPMPWEILIVNNRSTDNTQAVLEELADQDGVPLRFVREDAQGITFARNRAISEAIESDYLFFMDDDELPCPGILSSACDALDREGADCVGGQVKVSFAPGKRPDWLVDELLGFLAETNYGSDSFWISDLSTPLWTANIAYKTSIFRDDTALRFDHRYNRSGAVIGGGEDAIMFRELVARKMKVRYRPDMIVEHYVEDWRLKRSYFLKLHFESGKKYGQFSLSDYPRAVFGVPPFLITQAAVHTSKAALMTLGRDRLALRKAMTACHSFGTIRGCYLKWRNHRQ